MHSHCVCGCAIGHLALNLSFTKGHEAVAHSFYIKQAHAPTQQPSTLVSQDQQQAAQACRGVFGDEQNALRARSIQRVQLWKGLQPSALSEAVSHFAKVSQEHPKPVA